VTTSPVSEVYKRQTRATCKQSTLTCQQENAELILTHRQLRMVAETPTPPLVHIRKPPVFCLIRTGFYSGASSFWIPTRQAISVGYYPSRNYQTLVEIGTPKHHHILLTDHHVSTLAEHLAAQVDALWRDEFYTVRDADFTMHSATPYKTAILTLSVMENKKSVYLKLQELQYLSYIFLIVLNQLAKYTEAMSDVMKCSFSNKFNYICCATTVC